MTTVATTEQQQSEIIKAEAVVTAVGMMILMRFLGHHIANLDSCNDNDSSTTGTMALGHSRSCMDVPKRVSLACTKETSP